MEFCLLSIKQQNEQQTSESLKLSICAATFLNTWIGHLNIRERLINLLNKRFFFFWDFKGKNFIFFEEQILTKIMAASFILYVFALFRCWKIGEEEEEKMRN